MPAIFPQIIVNGVLQRHVLPSFRRFQLSLFLTCNGYLYRRNQIAGKFNLSALLLSFHWQHLPMSSWQQISTHILKTNLCSPTEGLRSGPSKWVHLAATNSFWPALTNKNNIITHIHIMSSIFNSELPAAQWDTSGISLAISDSCTSCGQTCAINQWKPPDLPTPGGCGSACTNVDKPPPTAKLLAPQMRPGKSDEWNQRTLPCQTSQDLRSLEVQRSLKKRLPMQTIFFRKDFKIVLIHPKWETVPLVFY